MTKIYVLKNLAKLLSIRFAYIAHNTQKPYEKKCLTFIQH